MANYSTDDSLRQKVQDEAKDLHILLCNAANPKKKLDADFYDAALEGLETWYSTWKQKNYFKLRVFVTVVGCFTLLPLIAILLYKLVTKKAWFKPGFIKPLQHDFEGQRELLKKPVSNHIATSTKKIKHKLEIAEFPSVALVLDENKLGNEVKIGAGGGGIVFTSTLPDGKKAAVKVLQPAKKDDPELREDLVKEGRMLSLVRSPYVVQFYQMVEDPSKGLAILMEYVPYGTLEQLLLYQNKAVKWPQKFSMINEIALGIKAIHGANLVWGDVKTRNIFVHADIVESFWSAKITYHIKLGDFGIAHFEEEEVVGGTKTWMAPEVVQGKSTTKASDIYGFGLVMWQMVVQEKSVRKQLSESGEKSKLNFSKKNPRFAALILKCVNEDARSRGTIVEVIDDLETVPQPK